MTAVYTDPKRYKAATPVSYLSGEDKNLYLNLGPITNLQVTTRKMNALANLQLGIQALNLFWYDLAILKFKEAQKQDPNLVMAYWGEAMCYKQPLWQTEQLDNAAQVFARIPFSATNQLTEREQGYLAAAQLYLNQNISLQERETTYTKLMVDLYDNNQDDPDACALAALSMLGQLYSLGDYLSPSDADVVSGKLDLLLGNCVADNPKHAGLLHYQTVFYDVRDLSLAQLGIAPSQQLAKVAPASNVAQHMRSHIFLRFGNYSQVVAANQAAVAASDSYCKAVGQGNACDADNRWHALEWVLYGQTQQCAFTAASTTFARMQSVAASMNYTDKYVLWLYRTYAHLQLQSLNSLGAIPLRSPADNATGMLPQPLYNGSLIQDAADISDHFWPPHAESNALLARVYALVASSTAQQQQSPDVSATVTAALARLDAIVAMLGNATVGANSTAQDKGNRDMSALVQAVRLQAYALVAASACAANNTAKCTDWVPLMEQAMLLYNSTLGAQALPTLLIAPTPEFYGNLLLLNTTSANAAAADAYFQLCLSQQPNRMQCLLGRARAAKGLANAVAMNQYYTALVSQCGTAGDARFGPLMEARNWLGYMPPPPSNRGAGRRGTLRAVGEEEEGTVVAALAA